MQPETGLVVVAVALDRRRVVEFAGRADRLLARVGASEAGRFVPVEVVDSVRIFGVGLMILAGEDLGLLGLPAFAQSLDRRALVSLALILARVALVKRNRVGDVGKRSQLFLGKLRSAMQEDGVHGRGHEVE